MHESWLHRVTLQQAWGNSSFDLQNLLDNVEFEQDVITDLHFVPGALGMSMALFLTLLCASTRRVSLCQMWLC